MDFSSFCINFAIYTFIEIVFIIEFIFFIFVYKRKQIWYTNKQIASIIISTILFIGVLFFFIVPDVKDCYAINHDKYSTIEGSTYTFIRNSIKLGKYFAKINNIEVIIDGDDYYYMGSGGKYKITYLPNSKIAIRIEKR